MSLQADNLSCVRGRRALFSALHAEVGAGEVLWVKGANGSGKTSLLHLLCGLARPAGGTVRWRGSDITRLRQDFHRDLFYLGHAGALKSDLTAIENLWLGTRLAGRPCTRLAAGRALEQAGLGPVAHLPAGNLSQGQRKRVVLAGLHLQPFALLVMDEPFSALDPAAQTLLEQALDQQVAQGAALVYTTHQAAVLQAARHYTLALGAPLPC